jgi:hypothetical protein
LEAARALEHQLRHGQGKALGSLPADFLLMVDMINVD